MVDGTRVSFHHRLGSDIYTVMKLQITTKTLIKVYNHIHAVAIFCVMYIQYKYTLRVVQTCLFVDFTAVA